MGASIQPTKSHFLAGYLSENSECPDPTSLRKTTITVASVCCLLRFQVVSLLGGAPGLLFFAGISKRTLLDNPISNDDPQAKGVLLSEYITRGTNTLWRPCQVHLPDTGLKGQEIPCFERNQENLPRQKGKWLPRVATKKGLGMESKRKPKRKPSILGDPYLRNNSTLTQTHKHTQTHTHRQTDTQTHNSSESAGAVSPKSKARR